MVLRRRAVERRYQIGRRIATGGMSEIYDAYASDMERQLVLKRLIFSEAQAEDIEARFLRETAIVGALDHPNVVEVVDVGQYQKDFVLLMERVPGLTLAEIIEQLRADGGAFEVDMVCGIIGQVARGLAHAHDRTMPDGAPLGIVHRDVAPDNVLVTPSGVPKVLDFGIATLDGANLTEPGLVRGRERYLSPEQANAEKVDARTDVFSLGAVMFELLTLEPLYDAANEAALLFKVQDGSYEPIEPRLQAAGVDADLIAIVKKACAASRDERIRSAREFERMLDRFRAARGLRIDSASIGAVVKQFDEAATVLRTERAGTHRGELADTALVLPADNLDRREDSDISHPALPATPDEPDPDVAQPRRKQRMERLERKPTPNLPRPPSLALPVNPVVDSGPWAKLKAIVRGEQPPTVPFIVGVGLGLLALAFGVVLLASLT